MAAPERKKTGRKAYTPSDDDRRVAAEMAAGGATHETIAAALGISKPTLRKHLAEALSARAGETLFDAPVARAPRRPDRNAGGRKAWRPGADDRRRVMDLCAFRKGPAEIARALGVSEPTLRKHFAAELAVGAEKVEAEMIEALMRQARKGNVSALKAAQGMIAQARLDEIERALGPRARKAAVETPGKKAQADLDAAEALERGPWAEHLRTH